MPVGLTEQALIGVAHHLFPLPRSLLPLDPCVPFSWPLPDLGWLDPVLEPGSLEPLDLVRASRSHWRSLDEAQCSGVLHVLLMDGLRLHPVLLSSQGVSRGAAAAWAELVQWLP